MYLGSEMSRSIDLGQAGMMNVCVIEISSEWHGKSFLHFFFRYVGHLSLCALCEIVFLFQSLKSVLG